MDVSEVKTSFAKNILIVLVGLLLMTLTYTWWQSFQASSLFLVSTYRECVAKGYPILNSYPQRCQTPDGRTFVSPNDPPITVQ